jgi:DNA polymerase III gamma/tau subunit
MELVHKYRPKRLKDVIGQKEASAMLLSMVTKKKIPHAILFSGPSGVGKTTFARIMKEKLKCHESDYMEINAAKERGIEMARDISNRASLAPFSGGSRVWCLDEAHKLTSDAQNGLLKVLEDPPKSAYFILCTTEPSKIIKTIRSRCTEIALKTVPTDEVEAYVKTIAKKEKIDLSEEEAVKIADVSEGCVRDAVKILDAISGIEDAEERSNAIRRSSTEEEAINLARCLMDSRKQWQDCAKILQGIEDDPEGVRQLVLSYCRSVILKSGMKRAAHIMECLREPIYSSPKPLLALACFDVYFSG